MYAKINSVSIFPGTATQLHIGSAAIVGFGEMGRADILWTLCDDNKQNLKSSSSMMPISAYLKWTGEDADLFVWLAGELGLTITEIVNDPLPAETVFVDDNKV